MSSFTIRRVTMILSQQEKIARQNFYAEIFGQERLQNIAMSTLRKYRPKVEIVQTTRS